MNINYSKAKDEMRSLKGNLDKVLQDAPAKSFEDGIAFRSLENIIEQLDTAIWKIEHFSKTVVEGRLHEMENGKFELIDSNGESVRSFSCGNAIECFVEYEGDMQWFSGRVEHTTKNGIAGYYFYFPDADNPFLYEGMRSRIRKD